MPSITRRNHRKQRRWDACPALEAEGQKRRVRFSCLRLPFFLPLASQTVRKITPTLLLRHPCSQKSVTTSRNRFFVPSDFSRSNVRLRETDTNVNSSLGHVKRGHLGDRSDGPFFRRPITTEPIAVQGLPSDHGHWLRGTYDDKGC